MEGLSWFVGENDYAPEIILPSTPVMYFRVRDFGLRHRYFLTYMYDDELANNSMYTTTYSTKVQDGF